MTKIFRWLLILILSSNISFAQDLSKQIDSIKNELSKLAPDTNKVNALNDAAWNYKTKDAAFSKKISTESYSIALKLNYEPGQIEALNLIGNVMDNQGDYPQALRTYRKALAIAKKLDIKKNIAGLINNIGLIYEHTGESDSALMYYNSALELKKELGNKASIASTLNNIGNIYWAKSDYNKALEFYFSSLKIKEELDDKKLMSSGYHNIANIYLDMSLFELAKQYELKATAIRLKLDDFWGLGASYNTLGLIFSNQKNYTKAIESFKKGIDYSEKVSDPVNLAKIYSGLSQAYYGMKSYALAEEWELKAIEIKKVRNDVKGLCVSYNHLGGIFLAQNKTAEARHWYFESNAAGKKLGNKKAILESLDGISNTYLKENKSDSALYFLRSYANMKDSVMDESRIKEIAGLQIKYETEVKQREIDSLNLQKARSHEELLTADLNVQRRNYLLLAAFILLLAGGISFYLYRKNQKIFLAKEKATSVLETEISERQRIARDMHDELGTGLSKIAIAQQFAKGNMIDKRVLDHNLSSIGKATTELVESMGDLIWSLNNEDNTLDALLARIRSHASDYLEEAGIDYEINIPDDLKNRNLFKDVRHQLYLTFKEALNNAVKHSGAKFIAINIISSGGKFNISISDNGKGFSLEDKLQKGNGLGNMQQRMQSIGGEIIFDMKESEGTNVQLVVNEIKLFNDEVPV